MLNKVMQSYSCTRWYKLAEFLFQIINQEYDCIAQQYEKQIWCDFILIERKLRWDETEKQYMSKLTCILVENE